MRHLASWITILLLTLAGAGCEVPYVERPEPPAHEGVHGLAGGCYVVDATSPGSTNTRWLGESGTRFRFNRLALEDGARFLLQPTDLGTYLLRDEEGAYLLSEGGELGRSAELESDVLLVDDSFVSPAEWEVQLSANDPERFQMRQLRTGEYLTKGGLTEDESRAAVVAFYPSTGCADFPELSVDAEGAPTPRTFPDGDLYGVADAHSHLFTNYGFGGSGVVHGSPFHRLGVEHALSDCETYHGPGGERDLMGFFYGEGTDSFDTSALATVLLQGTLGEFTHHTDGYPDFTDWPNARKSYTHNSQYYRWIERAYLGGLRLIVQHATGNQVLCELMNAIGAQPYRYSCNEMVGVERQIDETYALERYIDAQAGGPGMGWFRVVTSPDEARDVIEAGKLAVVLGIETSNVLDCFISPRPGDPICDEAHVREQLDHFHERGVRVIFPVHKYDNGFSAGDGHRGFLELGNFVNSGHWSNYTTNCEPSVSGGFDKGDVFFGGLNQPRMDYFAPAPNDFSDFANNPVPLLLPYVPSFSDPPLVGDYCQNAGLQPLGEFLFDELMHRGMVIEVDHLPQHAYVRAYEILEANDYPAAGTHGRTNDGRIFALGGIVNFGLSRCADPLATGSMGDSIGVRLQEITDNGGYPGIPFGFDLNGFAGGAKPRFGPDANCPQPQSNPITYPFDSYSGDVSFTQPWVGNRSIDFNTEGMVHIGMMPELIEDVRRDGVTDQELEPVFRSAEAWVRMWERSEARGAILSMPAP